MPIYTKGKIPWTMIIIVLLLLAFAVFALATFFKPIGVGIENAATGAASSVYVFFIVHPSSYSVVIAVVITAGLLILITERKYFFKQKISNMPAGAVNPNPVLQSQLMQSGYPAQQLASPVIAAAPIAGIDPSKTEVTTT